MTTNDPLVTVNSLSFNRNDDLRNTLRHVFEQNYTNIEVIVVDNASSDGSAEMVRSEFTTVLLIELTENIGIAGWNRGFDAAKGEFVLVLDDDSYPCKDTLGIAVQTMTQDATAGAVAFRIFNERGQQYETEHFRPGPILSFIGCGALLRKNIFQSVGVFRNQLFVYVHEEDFSIRLYNAGMRIIFVEEAVAVHCSSMIHRNINTRRIDARKYYFITRNTLLTLFYNFAMRKVMVRMLRILAGRLYFGLQNGAFLPALKGFGSFIICALQDYKGRRIVSDSVHALYLNGKYFGGFFSYRGVKKEQ